MQWVQRYLQLLVLCTSWKCQTYLELCYSEAMHHKGVAEFSSYFCNNMYNNTSLQTTCIIIWALRHCGCHEFSCVWSSSSVSAMQTCYCSSWLLRACRWPSAILHVLRPRTVSQYPVWHESMTIVYILWKMYMHSIEIMGQHGLDMPDALLMYILMKSTYTTRRPWTWSETSRL